jgi:hypothetical protein
MCVYLNIHVHTLYMYVYGHVRSACSCCMSLLHVFATSCCCMSMLQTSCPCSLSILYVHSACLFRGVTTVPISRINSWETWFIFNLLKNKQSIGTMQNTDNKKSWESKIKFGQIRVCRLSVHICPHYIGDRPIGGCLFFS